MAAVESTLDRDTEISGAAAQVGELLRLLVKTGKALRMYQPGNELSTRFEEAFFTGLSAHLEEQGALELGVRESQITWAGSVVYESRDRKDSLARLLYRDGIRWLSFHPGLDREELHSFLGCVSRASSLTIDQDDLVTLLWSHDFRSIRYVAVNELSPTAKESSLESRLAGGAGARVGSLACAGSSEGSGRQGDPGGGADPDAVSVKDLPQPAAHLPIEACRLSGQEIQALNEEVLREEVADPTPAAVDLALELTALETAGEERRRIADQLAAILRRRLLQGEIGSVAACVHHLASLDAGRFEDSAPIDELRSTVLHAMAAPELLGSALEQAGHGQGLGPEELSAYLVALGSEALPCLVPLMGRPRTPAFRRALMDAIMAGGVSSLEALGRHLASTKGALDSGFLGEALHLMAQFNHDASFTCLSSLLASESVRVRRQSAQALGRFAYDGVDDLCLQLQGDGDPEVRSAALDALVRRGRPASAGSLFSQVVDIPGFLDRALPEKRRVLAAVARLGGEEALEWISELLRQAGSRWFASRKEREVMQAAVYGMRRVDTERAWEVIRDLASSGNRFVRRACAKELRERGS